MPALCECVSRKSQPDARDAGHPVLLSSLCVMLLLEVCLHLMAEGIRGFVCAEDWTWNWPSACRWKGAVRGPTRVEGRVDTQFPRCVCAVHRATFSDLRLDVFVVTSSWVELLVDLTSSGDSTSRANSNLRLMRLLRVGRLFRVVRIIRVVQPQDIPSPKTACLRLIAWYVQHVQPAAGLAWSPNLTEETRSAAVEVLETIRSSSSAPYEHWSTRWWAPWDLWFGQWSSSGWSSTFLEFCLQTPCLMQWSRPNPYRFLFRRMEVERMWPITLGPCTAQLSRFSEPSPMAWRGRTPTICLLAWTPWANSGLKSTAFTSHSVVLRYLMHPGCRCLRTGSELLRLRCVSDRAGHD